MYAFPFARCRRMQAQPPARCRRMQPMPKCRAPPNSYWLGALSHSHGTRAHHKNREGGRGGGGVRCKKKHKGKKDVIRTGQYNAHFVCRMMPDAGISFLLDAAGCEPSPLPDATGCKNFAGCWWKIWLESRLIMIIQPSHFKPLWPPVCAHHDMQLFACDGKPTGPMGHACIGVSTLRCNTTRLHGT